MERPQPYQNSDVAIVPITLRKQQQNKVGEKETQS